jgi:hypothetical protein
VDAPLEEVDSGETLLHYLTNFADPFDYFTRENQVILAKQLIEHGANANAVTTVENRTPLHNACFAGVVTNLDFVELLLKEGADPNAQDHLGKTPLMNTIPDAPGAAKYLLNWPTTDANMTMRSGESFLDRVRLIISAYSHQFSMNPSLVQVPNEFLLQQWRDIEVMMVERAP